MWLKSMASAASGCASSPSGCASCCCLIVAALDFIFKVGRLEFIGVSTPEARQCQYLSTEQHRISWTCSHFHISLAPERDFGRDWAPIFNFPYRPVQMDQAPLLRPSLEILSASFSVFSVFQRLWASKEMLLWSLWGPWRFSVSIEKNPKRSQKSRTLWNEIKDLRGYLK